jgi:hypothetical protein
MIRRRPIFRDGSSLARIRFVTVRGLTDNRLAASGTETAKICSASFMLVIFPHYQLRRQETPRGFGPKPLGRIGKADLPLFA